MKSYIWLTFGFVGWGYYEASGGSEFEPEVPMIAAVEVEAVETPEIVARAPQQTLLAVSTSNVAPMAEPYSSNAADVVAAPAEPVAEVVAVVAPVVEPVLDIRRVAGSRVNMRMGPSTSFDVITTLQRGAELEVLQVNEAGWANVSIVDTGLEGWMAERLLTEPQT